MTRWQNILFKSVPAIVGLCIVLFIGSSLSTSKYYTELTRFGYPICSIDRHRFYGETCESCGRDVVGAGVFFSADIAIEENFGANYQLSFKDYYESYEAFKADYDMCLTYAVIVIVVVISEVCVYVFAFLWSRKDEQQRRLRGHNS